LDKLKISNKKIKPSNSWILYQSEDKKIQKIKTKKYKKNKKNIKKIKFSQSIKKQKKSLKIYWKTISSSKIILNFAWKDYEIFSDKDGKYSLKLNNLKVWNFEVKSKVILKNNLIYFSGKDFLIWKIKKISLDKKYVEYVNNYKKNILLKKSKKKKSNKKNRNILNIKKKKISIYTLRTPNFIFNNFIPIILNLLMWTVLILFWFLLYYKKIILVYHLYEKNLRKNNLNILNILDNW
jgi:hypothetical protein